MKRQYALQIAVALVLMLAFILSPFSAITAYAQTEAGFLDSCVGNCRDYYGIFEGSTWYCIDYTSEYDPILEAWIPVRIIVAGGFPTQPNCNAG